MSKASAQKKIQEITLKIEQLKIEQHQAQQQIAADLVTVIDKHQGFNLNLNVLVGLLIDGINKAQADDKQAKAWEDMGLKFRKTRTTPGTKSPTQSAKAA